MTAARVGWPIRTASGRLFWPLDPRPEEVDVGDVAHALAHLCRFGGHVRSFYSVGQHSVLVSQIIERELERPDLAMLALLHDAAEAYVGDVVGPIKRHLRVCDLADVGFNFVEAKVLGAIFDRLSVLVPSSRDDTAAVDRADLIALATEKRDLMGEAPGDYQPHERDLPAPVDERISPLYPRRAQQVFLERWAVLRRRTS